MQRKESHDTTNVESDHDESQASDISSFQKISNGFVNAVIIALDDVSERVDSLDTLFETIGTTFSHIIRLSTTVTQSKGPSQRLIGEYVHKLHKKFDLVAESVVMVENPDCLNPTQPQLLAAKQKQMERLGKIFAEIMMALHFQKSGLTNHAARLIISFVMRVLTPAKPLTLNLEQELCWQLCLVADKLFYVKRIANFHHTCQLLLSFIENAPNYDRGAFTQLLMKDQSFTYSRIYILSLVYLTGKACDSELMLYLCDQSQKLVFYDKNTEAKDMMHLFTPFFQNIDEKSYIDCLHPNVVFCMNRSRLLLCNIASMVARLSFKLATKTALMLTTELISKDILTTDCTKDVVDLYEAVCQRAGNKTELAEKLIGGLYGILDEISIKVSVPAADKLRLVQLIGVCAQALDAPHDKCISAACEIMAGSKDVNYTVPASIVSMLSKGGKEQVAAIANKFSTAHQIETLTKVGAFDCKETIFDKLESLNFEVASNTSFALQMCNYLIQAGMAKKIAGSKALEKYLLSRDSSLNQPATIKKLSRVDVENHINTISALMVLNLSSSQQSVLESVMLEYLMNQDYAFSGTPLWKCIRLVQKNWSEDHLVQMLNQLFVRVHKSQSEHNYEVLQTYSTTKKVSNFLSFVIPRTIKLQRNTIVALLKLAGHPAVSPNQRVLSETTKYLIQHCKLPWTEMLEENFDFLIQIFLKDRTGILSPDPIVRQIAVNILSQMGQAGLLLKILPEMMPIFNYKPVEMLQKMEKLLQNEFEKMSHYDLMFYSEMTKDMQGFYKEKDETIIRQSLCQEDQQKEDENREEARPEIGADTDMDPALMAMLAKSKTKKGKKGKQPGKAAPAKAPEAKKPKEEEAPEISKEERNKLDREQMISFVNHLKQVKNRQFQACYQVLSSSTQSAFAQRLNYQESMLSYLTGPLLKLLSLVSTRFDAIFFLQNLLNNHPDSPFFSIKQHLLSGLTGVADNRMSNRTINDISTCLQNLNQNADFTQMGVGSLKICLTISNFVLKDPTVNLSVKEIGLAVSQSILMDCSVVQMIDLVRLTINMMKTNYISPNLNGFLRKLLRRINRFELALLLQPLFQYQPVPRKVLMSEILAFDEPLFNPVWYSSQMWILLFDEELSGLARKIWNKFGMALRTECVELQREVSDKNIFHYLRDEQFGTYSLTTKALGSAMEIFRLTPRLMKITEDLIAFYHSEWDLINKLASQAVQKNPFDTELKVQVQLFSDKRVNRVCVPQIFKRTAKLFQPQHFETILTFLITEACQDQNEEVREASNAATLALIKQQGPQHSNQLLTVLETFLNATSGKASLDSSKNQAVVLLGHLAQYLGDTAQKKLITSYEKLATILLTCSNSVQKAICKCIPQLAKFFPEKAKQYLETQMTILRTGKDEKQIRACSYVVAGLAKSLGMAYTKEQGFMETMTSECFVSKKTDAIRKQAGLYFYDAMSYIMGHSFEVYLTPLFPNILSSIADQREPVRTAALCALQTIMGQFSNFAIKQALPQFLSELQNDNWRSKYSTVEALGNMAFCAPKQISTFLPQIVKVLREILNDTHEKVHDAAIEAIKKIGSVIKCPEIGDLLEVIVKALSNTNTHLNEALNLIINTSFAHAIDAPSLSLLVPLLDAGLTMHDNKSKEMSATLMGNICSLTQDPRDLLPYMSILVPAIKSSLFDAIPEIRAAAAKGLGKLSRGLGQAQAVEMLGWLREHMDQQTISSSEKSGAAQGFAEMISSHGKDYFEVYIQEVIKKAQAEETYLREAYRGVLVFLPGCYDRYVDYLPTLVPIMIQGLADDVDEVRKISMRNVKICIKQYGRSNPFQLINPVLRMMFSPDYRVRESSSILMFQLIKELENDIIKATPAFMDQETKFKILSTMFILRYDPIEKVNNQASQIWKSLIDNQLLVLRQVIDTCIQIIFQIIQSPSEELQEMGLQCIRGIVEKMGEKLVGRAIEIFEQLLEKSTDKAQSVGICKVMYNMAGSASHRLLQIISPRLLAIMDPYLSAEQVELRKWSSKVFITVFQKQSEKTFVDGNLENSILMKLKQFTQEKNEVEAERLLQTLRYLVDKAPGLKIEDRMLMLCDITERSHTQLFSIAQARIIRVLASTFASKVFTKKFYYGVLVALQEELRNQDIDSEERIQYVLIAYAELLARIGVNEIVLTNEEISRFCLECTELQRPNFYLDFIIHYCQTTENNFEKMADTYLENCLKFLNHPDENMVAKVVASINAVMEKLPKETQMLHVSLIRRQIEVSGVQVINTQHSLQSAEGNMIEHLYKKKVPTLQIFKTAPGVQAVVNYVQAAIMHGSVQIRIDAAFTLKYVLDFSEPAAIKKEIIKICGALIRVVNDKFPSELKMQIFLALKLIQQKYADSTKAMAAQLQTTFLKALGDSSMNEHVLRVILENLILLVQGLTRVDPIIKELLSLLDGNKIEGRQKQLAAEALALIIRAKGKAITSTMQETLAASLTEILQNAPSMTGNDDIITANCAVAMAFLSAYADPGQMQTLCSAFPGGNPTSVGIKFGVLTNGNDTVDKKQIITDLKQLLVDYLQKSSGFKDPLGIESRFSGAYDLVCHLLNAFARRDWCQQPTSPYIALMFEAINESGVLKSLKSANGDQFKLLLEGLSILPVKPEMSPACQQFLADAFACIQENYLGHPELNSLCSDAILNCVMLTCDNWLATDSMKSTDRERVKQAMQHASIQKVISDDMKLYAIDIVFKKK